MSHYPVLVVSKDGQDLDQQLAPFDENLDVEFEDDAECDVDERTGRRGYWRNPDAKWDWYSVGGRWSDLLIRKDGSRCDSALVGELDVDRMRRDARIRAAGKLRALDEATAEHGPLPSRGWVEWFSDDARRDEATAARDAYWRHPTIRAIQPLGLDFEDLEWIERSRDGWLEGQAARGVVGFALLTHDGRWMAEGRMGWFGISDSTVDSKIGYAEAASAYVAALDDTYRLTVVDCHI